MGAIGDAISYYPSQKYLDKNWAPEKVPASVVEAIAKNAVRAERGGLLDRTTADKLLPIGLTEGRYDMGANDFMYPPSPRRDAAIRAMGIPRTEDMPTGTPGIRASDEYSKGKPIYLITQPQGSGQGFSTKGWAGGLFPGQIGWQPTQDAEFGNSDMSARLAALLLSEKAKLYGPDKAVERWNGQGDMSKQYAGKVGAIQNLMDQGMNPQLVNAYKQYRQRYEQGGVDNMTNSTAALPPDRGIVGAIGDAITGAQRSIRDWTAF